MHALFEPEELRAATAAARALRRGQAVRAAVVAAALAALATQGGRLERVLPGSDRIEALQLAALVGGVMGAVWALSERAVRRALPVRTSTPPVRAFALLAIALVMLGSVSFVVWSGVAASGSLVVVPVFTWAAAFVMVTAFGFLHRLGVQRALDDPALERRLLRFTRDAGVPAVRAIVWGSEDDEGTIARARKPDVSLQGTAVSGMTIAIPVSMLRTDPAVLEAHIAREIVRLRRVERIRRNIAGPLVDAAVIAPVALIHQDGLAQLAGVPSVASPGFLPMVVLVAGAARVARQVVLAWFRRRLLERELVGVLDLTRDPAALLRSIRRDVDELLVDPDPPRSRRLFSSRLSLPEALEVIDAWRASRRVCLLFTDVVGSTDWVGRIGDDAWYEVLSDHDDVIRAAADRFAGIEIDKPGDGFVLLFEDVGRGVLAAIEMQRALTGVEVAPGVPLQVRMGLHAGEVIRRGRTIVGREVHFAARVGAAAGAGEILVSGETRDELEPSGRFRFGSERTVDLKGFEGRHAVVPVMWREVATADDRSTPVGAPG